MLRIGLMAFLAMVWAGAARADSSLDVLDAGLTGPDAEAAVAECLEQPRETVAMLADGRTVCWTAGIFPVHMLALVNLLPEAERIVFSSRGGNVLTAITLANYLDDLDVPVIIAGQCVSACASVVVPGLRRARIHRSAFLVIHGITSFDGRTFMDDYRERKGLADDGRDAVMAELMVPNAWNYYRVQWPRSVAFLNDRGIDPEYMGNAEARMIRAKAQLGCPLELFDYFAVLSPEHVRAYLGGRLAIIDDFATQWDAPGVGETMPMLRKIDGEDVLVYRRAMEAACAERG